MSDNHSLKIRLINDAHALARMASINHELIEEALDENRAFAQDGGSSLSLMFPRHALKDLRFAAQDLKERADSIIDRLDLLEYVDDPAADQEAGS
jgi:hypothetical protein